LTQYSRGVSTPLEAWRLILDEGCLRHIGRCTEEYAQISNENWKTSEQELDSFIGLLYLRAVMNHKNFPMKLLWSENFGCAAFRETMSRNRFEEIKKNIRFDERSTRSERLQTDKFVLMSWILTDLLKTVKKVISQRRASLVMNNYSQQRQDAGSLSLCHRNPINMA
jgi:hypothetical protein